MQFKLCSLSSGSSGNSIYIEADSSRILLDAGKPGSFIESRLRELDRHAADLDGILVSHEHIDHIQGIGVLARRHKIPVYANEKTWAAMSSKIGPVPDSLLRIFDNEEEFYIKDIAVQSFAISHDAADPQGFSLMHAQQSIGFATDLGEMNDAILNRLKKAQLVFLESNYDSDLLRDGPYPAYLKARVEGSSGHLSNADCAHSLVELAEAGVRHFMLGHLSKTNNTPQLAYQASKKVLSDHGIEESKDVFVKLTRRDAATGIYTLEN